MSLSEVPSSKPLLPRAALWEELLWVLVVGSIFHECRS